jgi:hypothetical protein
VKNAYKLLVGKLDGRDYSEDLVIEMRKILELIEELSLRVWIGFIWIRIGVSGVSCEHDNAPSGSIKMGNFLTSSVTVSFPRRTLLLGV